MAKYRLKLFIVLLVFALLISFSIATVDYFRLKDRTIKNNEQQIEQATESVKYALKTIDRAYFYLDEETAVKMADYTSSLQNKYAKNPDFSTWDFKALAAEMGMDIYILNDHNKIIHSNNPREVGLDFSVCCKSFHDILTERRKSGELFVDGIDLDQESGKVKKYSYMATSDKKYMIELGYALENEPIFKDFDFIKVAEELTKDFSVIEGLHILNMGGIPFGEKEPKEKVPKRREAFEQAREKNEMVEMESVYNGKPATFRYVPYRSKYDTSSTQLKVVEIIYTKQGLQSLLRTGQKTYFIELAIILVITILITMVLANWLAKYIDLVYHDRLTGLKNCNSFDDHLEKVWPEYNRTLILLVMDLDNFKSVNAVVGYKKGDTMLKGISHTIKTAASENETFHLGGDRFAIVMHKASLDEAKRLAQYVIDKVEERVHKEHRLKSLPLTASIGIAEAKETITPKELFNDANIALQQSKEKGKNQFEVFQKSDDPNAPFTN